jgi:diadenosine tetraphosphate (Ap4A) HIT family hydrolase
MISNDHQQCRSLKQAQEAGVAPWTELEKDLPATQVFFDLYPVTPGHRLYVPKQNDNANHIVRAMEDAMADGLNMISQGVCDGFNIGLNMGTAAGQTVMYPHVHLIPRRTGDVADPVGGVRGVIPGQANYKKADYKNPVNK